ncbi:hypothetical protein H696_03037 [Fonticula alba]|uniref:Uncharacterized protein n=1 Tax=Fonticula alba TaxID=691883 RepID=A0A058Z9S6_FONAL|nr:hypothetical protein H696_03037 [Fonticula alba]KCV70683.1 hypothetical protein H696_03037 [Fonticula alba]|eukprot:XP_009495199.1 hypothetical protein H696_03037 [Fonticula alba]
MRLRRGLPALLAFAFITGAFLGAVVIGSLYADRERDQIIITRADTPMEAAARVAGCLGRAPGAGGELDEMPLGPAKLLRMVRPALSLGVCEVSPSTLRHRILNHAVQGSAACRPSIRLATIPVECPFPGDLLMGSEENRQALLAKGRSEADLMLVASEADREVRLNGQTLLGLTTPGTIAMCGNTFQAARCAG